MEMKEIDELSNRIIGLAIEVHRNLGPGLLESVYQRCLAYEFTANEIEFEWENPIQVKYKGISIDCGFRADLIVANSIKNDSLNLCALCVLCGLHQFIKVSPGTSAIPRGQIPPGGWRLLFRAPS